MSIIGAMIGPAILGISAIVFVVGICVVCWDWVARSDPDAPHGGPIVAFAVVGMLCGGIVSCGEAVKDVQQMKHAAEQQTGEK